MITKGKKHHYLAVTNISALFQRISSNHDEDLYCLNCFSSYSCRIEMPKQVEKTLKYNPGEKSLKTQCTICIDLECILKKQKSCKNNPEKSYTEKKLYMNLLVGQCLKNLCLMKKKINLIIAEEKIVLKNYVKK